MQERRDKSQNKTEIAGISCQDNPSVIGKASTAGITLVALVVTIVVLLILAGITLTYVLGDKGIINLAKDAKNKTEEATQKEQDDIGNLVNMLKEEIGSGGEKIRVGDLVGKPAKNINQAVVDDYDNKITVPAGFIVVGNGTDGVEYNYSGDKRPNVQDGIVIEDEEGNQFVWIPVGEIKNKSGDSKGPTTNIQLARYTFNITIDPDTYEITGGTGAIETTKTDGSILHDEYSGEEWGYLEEVSTSTTYGNTKAKDIEDFKTKAKSNGGYYLARYEASKGADNKVKSKSATVWNNVTQPDAATAARGMYTSSSFESDLVNSYAWDTAIVFIQTYSGDNDYSKKVGSTFSRTLKDTGTTEDKRCNIYDMASNTAEWTTETATGSGSPCTSRGGYSYNDSYAYTALRYNTGTSISVDTISFRPLLNVK